MSGLPVYILSTSPLKIDFWSGLRRWHRKFRFALTHRFSINCACGFAERRLNESLTLRHYLCNLSLTSVPVYNPVYIRTHSTTLELDLKE